MGQRFVVSLVVDTDDLPTQKRLEDEIKNALDLSPLDIWVRECVVTHALRHDAGCENAPPKRRASAKDSGGAKSPRRQRPTA